jgi:hypothetical protein
MISRNVFVSVGSDRFYMNEPVAEAFLAAQRRRALVVTPFCWECSWSFSSHPSAGDRRLRVPAPSNPHLPPSVPEPGDLLLARDLIEGCARLLAAMKHWRCTFFAALLRQSPEGLPSEPYGAVPPALATRIQKTAWEVVRTHPDAGIAQPENHRR